MVTTASHDAHILSIVDVRCNGMAGELAVYTPEADRIAVERIPLPILRGENVSLQQLDQKHCLMTTTLETLVLAVEASP